MSSETIIGAVGSFLVLLGFIMLQLKIWTSHSTPFLTVNLVGSILLVAYAILLNTLPFLLLNIVWALVALIGLLRRSHDISKS
jgi:hypothetical protein